MVQNYNLIIELVVECYRINKSSVFIKRIVLTGKIVAINQNKFLSRL